MIKVSWFSVKHHARYANLRFVFCRCACFYGPSCPGSLDDPCQPYRLPPPPPEKFTLYYNGKRQQCSSSGCRDTYFSGREIQSLPEFKKRDDVFENYWSATLVLPSGKGSSFVQVTIIWPFLRVTGPRFLGFKVNIN